MPSTKRASNKQTFDAPDLAAFELKHVKRMLYFLGLARSSCMTEEVVMGKYSDELHDVMQTQRTLPWLVMDQECPDHSMRNKPLAHVLRSLPPRLAEPGSLTMRWEHKRPSVNVECGPLNIDDVDYLFVDCAALELKLSVLSVAVPRAQRARWREAYTAEKAATVEGV